MLGHSKQLEGWGYLHWFDHPMGALPCKDSNGWALIATYHRWEWVSGHIKTMLPAIVRERMMAFKASQTSRRGRDPQTNATHFREDHPPFPRKPCEPQSFVPRSSSFCNISLTFISGKHMFVVQLA